MTDGWTCSTERVSREGERTGRKVVTNVYMDDFQGKRIPLTSDRKVGRYASCSIIIRKFYTCSYEGSLTYNVGKGTISNSLSEYGTRLLQVKYTLK